MILAIIAIILSCIAIIISIATLVYVNSKIFDMETEWTGRWYRINDLNERIVKHDKEIIELNKDLFERMVEKNVE